MEAEVLLTTTVPLAQRTMSQKSSITDFPSRYDIRCPVHTSLYFGDIATLLKHLKEHHGTSCLLCDEDLSLAPISKKSHRQQCHGDAAQSQTSSRCPICGKSQLSHCDLNNHLTTIHGKSFCCLQKICGFPVSAAIDTQLTSGVSKPLEKHPNNEVLCGVSIGNGMRAKRQHRKAVHSNGPTTYLCQLCDSGPILEAYSQYANHMTQAHGLQFCCKSYRKMRIISPIVGDVVRVPTQATTRVASQPSTKETIAYFETAPMDGQLSANANHLEPSKKVSDKEVEPTYATSGNIVCCSLHPETPFPDMESFTQHLKDSHSLTCLFCGKESSTSSERQEHRLKYHANCNDVTRLPCSLCAKTLKSHQSLSAHLTASHGKAFCCAEGICGVRTSSDPMLEFCSEATMQEEAAAVVIEPKPEAKRSYGQSQENKLPPGVLRLVHFVLSQQPDRRMTAAQLTQALKDSYGINSWGGDSDLLNLIINGRSSLVIETSDTEEDADALWIKIK